MARQPSEYRDMTKEELWDELDRISKGRAASKEVIFAELRRRETKKSDRIQIILTSIVAVLTVAIAIMTYFLVID